jgi:hypothetical protein
LKAFQHRAVPYAAAVLLGLGVTAGCSTRPASVGQGPFYELASNKAYVEHPPRSSAPSLDGGVKVLGTAPGSGSSTTYLVAWISADGSMCYGAVSAKTPTGDVNCSATGSALANASQPVLYSPTVPVVTPSVDVVEFGFTRGPISEVDITMAGTSYRARVTTIVSSEQFGGYAFLVTNPDSANTDKVSKMIGMTKGGQEVSTLSPW